MKSTGIIRKIDPLGRIVLPMELRKSLGIRDHDLLEIHTEGSRIILEPVQPRCVYCGSADEATLTEHRGVHHCPRCLAELAQR